MEDEKKDGEKVFLAFKLEGSFGFSDSSNLDQTVEKPIDSAKFSFDETPKESPKKDSESPVSNKRRIVKPRRNKPSSPVDKITNSFGLLQLDNEEQKLVRKFVPTWKIILYMQEIVNFLGFDLYPMDILLEIRKRYHTMSSPVSAENAIVSTVDLIPVFATMKSPSGFFIESENDNGFFKLLVAEYGKHVISRITIDNHTHVVKSYEIVAGVPDVAGSLDGLTSVATFSQPISVCKDWDGNLLIVDCTGHKIRKIDAQTSLVSTFAGSIGGLEDGPALEAKFQHPSDICLHKDILYIVDSGNSQIRMIDKKLQVKTITYQSIEHDNNQKLKKPRSLCIDSNDNIYVTDFENSKVKKLTKVLPGSAEEKAWGKEFEYKLSTVLRAQFKQPYGICMDNEENIIVSDWGASNIRKIDVSGVKLKHSTLAGKISGYGDGRGDDLENTKFRGPCGIKVDSLGNIYVADYLNHMVRKISNEALVLHKPKLLELILLPIGIAL
jgi:sugar lactone lactonase YvrE